MALRWVVLTLTLLTTVRSQRPFFAGTRPIGYPEMVTSSTVAPVAAAAAVGGDGLVNRVGDDDVSTTTIRLPVEALGDKNLIDRISKLPVDQQPFWYLNWQALEANRRNPQTYPQRPSQFAAPLDTSQTDSRFTNTNSNANSNANSNSGSAVGFSSPVLTNVPLPNPIPSAPSTFGNTNVRPTLNVPVSNTGNTNVNRQPSLGLENQNVNRPTGATNINNPSNTGLNLVNANPSNFNTPSITAQPTNTNFANANNQVTNTQTASNSNSQTSDPNRGLPSSVELASVLGNRFGDDDVDVSTSKGQKVSHHGLQNSHTLDKVIFSDEDSSSAYYLPDDITIDDLYEFKYSRNMRKINSEEYNDYS